MFSDAFFIEIDDNRLREFSFKLLYNLLPTRKNLHKWKIINSNLCLNCHIEEDINHAFFDCELNKSLFTFVKYLIKKIFHTEIEINMSYLLTLENTDVDLVILIALWSIYKLILERNSFGFDKRNYSLVFLFKREVEKRIKLNNIRQREDKYLPNCLLYYIQLYNLHCQKFMIVVVIISIICLCYALIFCK